MVAPLLIVTGTGTSIGKTHVAVALARTWGVRVPVVALKPIESGVQPGTRGDADRLAEASTFHVKRSTPYAFPDALSPHLAARRAEHPVSLDACVDLVTVARRHAGGVLLELPGGLFSPLTDRLLNSDLCALLAPSANLLVAPDRLGALHDVIASVYAARTAGVALHAVALSPPHDPDRSTGTNAAELAMLLRPLSIIQLPRAGATDLAADPHLDELLRTLLSVRHSPASR